MTYGHISTGLNFGLAAFSAGENRWLEVAVKYPANSGQWTTLSPRKQLYAQPFALYSKASGDGVKKIVPGSGIGVNDTDPKKPVVSVNLSTLPPIPGGNIADGTITTGKIANNAVNNSKIAQASVAFDRMIYPGNASVFLNGNGQWTAPPGGISQISAGTGITVTNGFGPIATVAFSPATVTNGSISASKISMYPSDGSKYLAGDGNWKTISVTESDPTWSGNADSSSTIGRTGTVGIGTTAPSFGRLHVVQNSSSLYALAVEHLWTGSGSQTAIAGSSYSQFGAGGEFGNLSTSGTTYGVKAQVSSSSGYAGYFTGGRNYFSGNVGIGVTNPTRRLEVNGTSGTTLYSSTSGSGEAIIGQATGSGTGVAGKTVSGIGVYGNASGSTFPSAAGWFEGKVVVNGRVGIYQTSPSYDLHLWNNSAAKPTSSSWTIASDARLKKNIATIDKALDDLLSLRGVTYQWIDPATQGNMDGTYTGMIAQEVERVFPEWVQENADGYKTVTVIGFEGIVVEAMRELRDEKDEEIAALRAEKDAEILALQERVAKLEAIVEQLVADKQGAHR